MELWKDWRVKLYLAVLVLCIGSFLFYGLQFGKDFRGGTIIQLELEKSVDPTTMGTMVTVLSERLNGFGLKDMSVRPFGDNYITVEVSATDPGTIDQLKGVLSQQGKFEGVIDGEVVLHPEDIVNVKMDAASGYGYVSSTQKWQVPFSLSKEGSESFAAAAKGRCVDGECDRIYMFIDRPAQAAIVMPQAIYDNESQMRVNPDQAGSFPIDVGEFERNTLTRIFTADAITEDVVSQLKQGNYTQVVVPAGAYNDTSALAGYKVVTVTKGQYYWLWSAVNLQSILFLTEGVTSGEPIRDAMITGGSPDLKTAVAEMTRTAVILRSGRLPVSLSLASTNTVSPTLGSTFLGDSLVMGVIALFAVAFVVFLRYRQPRITALMMMANVSEMVMILGFTALIRQQIDVAAIAGIIASLGTGVDQFIIITDEIKRGEKAEIAESTLASIKKAFRIIMASAATVTAAMLPLMTLGLGLLKGFAITTLIGLFVGVFIVRPVFGKAVEKFR